MKTTNLLLASIMFLVLSTGLVAEDFLNIPSTTIRGKHSDKSVQRLSPGTYHFTLTTSNRARAKFKIKQKNAVLGVKILHDRNYGGGTYNGMFIVEARRLRSASGSAAGEYHNSQEGAGASASGAYAGDFGNVNATRKITFKVRNKRKRRMSYTLRVYR